VRYFPFKSQKELDLMGDLSALKEAAVVIVGGGGLAQPGAMTDALNKLADPARNYKLVAWGVGADKETNRNGILTPADADPNLHQAYDGFDIVGTRIHSPENYNGDKRFRWVPCASSLHPALLKFRDVKPSESIGFYAHKRVAIPMKDIRDIARSRGQKAFMGRLPRDDNSGNNIEAKLAFMARFEYIVTNSYHGVFWATLLRRKVVCVPFKNGLFSFRHKPAYLSVESPERAFDEAQVYPDALDECRAANIDFYCDIRAELGDV